MTIKVGDTLYNVFVWLGDDPNDPMFKEGEEDEDFMKPSTELETYQVRSIRRPNTKREYWSTQEERDSRPQMVTAFQVNQWTQNRKGKWLKNIDEFYRKQWKVTEDIPFSRTKAGAYRKAISQTKKASEFDPKKPVHKRLLAGLKARYTKVKNAKSN
ncbi:hypothetical protein MTBPR1_80167 [Candidatus Terasakiella magnetica]|uniref:Uncharacterized protein n=1 Tax=Candidatus Terasakiella magnetica TaxID=1867952 RepID=A0A1C3RLK5_9PROT|nr:hypothetical protein [Candidatus Terasakiella magnetica]SCA58113.1 hypothetical protein MTBPR1_80167 [Candidatus Terasakiella magnetica]